MTFKVVEYVYVGHGLQEELPGVTSSKIKKALGIKFPNAIYHKAHKYSSERIMVQHVETGERLTLYTYFGEWRIGGENPNSPNVVELSNLLTS